MNKCTTHLISENIAPKGATKIGVYNKDGKEVGIIPMGRLSRPTTKPLYTFCALSDIHLTYDTANADFQRALEYAESNCDFTCIAGDLTSTGSTGTGGQMELYRSMVAPYDNVMPIYAIAGNHETSYGNYLTHETIKPYTGQNLFYSFTKGNDVFIMLGHYGGYREGNGGWRSTEFLSNSKITENPYAPDGVDELQFLYNELETHCNQRCFVFIHEVPSAHGVGNPNNLYGLHSSASAVWNPNDGGLGQAIINLLAHYKNSVLFHGHSHTRFDLQTLDPKANYGEVVLADGRSYKSIHIPSLAVPRDIDADGSPKPLEDLYAESEGYIVEVHDNYIVLNGRDFVGGDEDGHWSALGTYKINTTLQTVEEGTFTDSTGIITT